jgi:hypothetical protein
LGNTDSGVPGHVQSFAVFTGESVAAKKNGKPVKACHSY